MRVGLEGVAVGNGRTAFEHCLKSLGFYPQIQVMCRRSLDLIFKAKLDLFDLFDVCPHKLLGKKSNGRWFETMWRSCDVIVTHRIWGVFPWQPWLPSVTMKQYLVLTTFLSVVMPLFFLAAIKKSSWWSRRYLLGGFGCRIDSPQRLCDEKAVFQRSCGVVMVTVFLPFWLGIFRPGFLFSRHRFLCVKARDTLHFFSEGEIPYKLAPIPTENRAVLCMCYVRHLTHWGRDKMATIS